MFSACSLPSEIIIDIIGNIYGSILIYTAIGFLIFFAVFGHFWPFLAIFGHFWPFFGHLLVISRVIYGYSLDFWTKMKNKTIFGNGIPSPFRWSNWFFDQWPFLAIFGDFW